MGREKLGAVIRKFDFLNAKKDGDEQSIGNQLIDFERQCQHDVTVEELKDVYAAFQEKVCVQRFGYRHSPSYWAAYSTKCVLDRLKRSLDDESEATELEFGRLDVYTWLAMLQAGPNSAHVDIMQKFRGDSFEKYLQTCQKEEIAQIFQTMKIKFTFDTNDTDLSEKSYGSFLCNEVKRIFEALGEEKLKLAQGEFIDLYFYYFKQIPYLTAELTTYVGYLLRDMVPHGSTVKNPYQGFKNVEVMKKHIQAITEMLVEFEGDIKDQRFENVLKFIVKAATLDKIIEPLFDCLMDLCVKLVQRKHLPENSGKILDVFRLELFRGMRNTLVPTSTMWNTSVDSLKVLIATVTDKLTKDMLSLIDEMINEAICKYTKQTPEEVKSLLGIVNMLLASGHQKLISTAKRVLNHNNLEAVLVWKKYLEEVKVILKTVGQQPMDKMWPERDSRGVGAVVDEYDNFMRSLLDKLKDAKVMPKLNQEIRTYIFDCLEDSPPAKSDLASRAADRDLFVIRKTDPPEFIEDILARCHRMLLNEDQLAKWDTSMNDAVQSLFETMINSYDGNGRAVTPRQHELFMAVFMTCLAGDDMDDTFFPPGQEKNGGVKFWLYRGAVIHYIALHIETATQGCCVGIVPELLKWAKMAEDDERDDVRQPSLTALQLFSVKPPQEMARSLSQIMDLFVNPRNMTELFTLVNSLYQYNPDPVHTRLSQLTGMYDTLKERDKTLVIQVLTTVAGAHPEVITDDQVNFLFQKCQEATWDQQIILLHVLYSISKRCPQKLQNYFPKLLNNNIFNEKTLSLRVLVISCAAGRNEKYNQEAIDFFMKLITHKDSTIAHQGLGQLAYMVKDHKDYMQKYKTTLQKIENTSTVPEVRQSCHNIIQVLEGKNYEDVFEDLYKELQEQQEITADLDEKLDHTMQTVITMGDHVTEHHKDLINVKKDLDDLEEKVDEIDEDLGETKVKVEEIDNKTMTNAPKWSRDLTKLMNPEHEADWRLLASRLGYCNDDIRAWAQQHDPCMALLSEWYATHKTSEANHAVLTALTEMNRMDGAAIVENAMKTTEGVVEDEDFEYPSPPPIFLSYQWGIQDEVKLLKQHLNLAGYECWMDIGQMGGGDKLFAKIDNGIRAAKIIVCCVTEKYAQSPNCNREVNLSVNLGKPMIPLLMEKMSWPPKGSMGPIFSEYLFIRFFQRGGEETQDNRYWPVPKFQELLMQLNYSVAPDESLIQKEYDKWWAPIVEDIVIDKTKGKSGSKSESSTGQESHDDSDQSPLVFLSYQWGKQPQVKALFQRIRSLGYTVWMDIFQMGGGDSLYDKIDRGVRGCKVVVSCVTPKYALSANCRREVSLADALKKPIIPLLLEQMKWPPDGPMSMVFTELLFINVYRDPDIQTRWTGEKFNELSMKISQYIGTSVHENTAATQKHVPDGSASKTKFVESKTKEQKPPAKDNNKPPSTAQRNQPPKKENTANTPVQQKASQEKASITSTKSGAAKQSSPEKPVRKAPGENASSFSTEAGKTDEKSKRKATTNTPSNKQDRTAEEGSQKDVKQESAKLAIADKPKHPPASEKSQSKSCAIL